MARYRGRIDSLIIDEVQNVAEMQHAALAKLITSECHVLTAGDIRQSIYGFREAYPSIFERAAEDGR
ncbi:UvrD-helicase domain-containing protein [Halobaculum roseum]|uniref:UvrD-helicase domain-containing protein n=1 Tax=Halobaculum roseum TaxID=2175149 RepID=A0ABD5MK85_9EURY